MDLNKIVSYSLRVGVAAGAALSLVGLTLWAFQGLGTVEPVSGSMVLAVVLSVFQGSVVGIVYLGVFVLIATPVFRVLISVLFFSAQKDRKFVAITLLVLGMLIFGLASQA